ncbi:MAG TPA: hypothetical protein VFE33_31005 [Thermoanaerobaculia bacterium]|nr:hypothetical protein [Thermoanaerobaculia bacterium]
MNLEGAIATAHRGRLYPSVILHGADAAARQAAAVELARLLLCAAPEEERPCHVCKHCRRIAWPEEGGPFHPDFHVLVRDLKASTSVDATRGLLRGAQVSPFEARGQVFVVASAESLTPEAANALLKALEEPHLTAPRNFFLLAPASLDLLPTLRSRSLAVYLGPADAVDGEAVAPLARAFGTAVAEYTRTGSSVYVLTAAEALGSAGGFEDPRSGRPWGIAAAAVLAVVLASGRESTLEEKARRALLALAEELLGGPALRLRGIPPERILEGLVARHLA